MTTLADEERGESAPRAHLPEQSTPTKTPKSQSAQLARLSKTTARQFKMATYNTLPVSADVEADKPLLSRDIKVNAKTLIGGAAAVHDGHADLRRY